MEGLLQRGRGGGTETAVSHHYDISVSQMYMKMHVRVYVLYSQLQQLAEEEAMSKDVFLERCMHNPMLRDRMPLLTHSLAHRKVQLHSTCAQFTMYVS